MKNTKFRYVYFFVALVLILTTVACESDATEEPEETVAPTSTSQIEDVTERVQPDTQETDPESIEPVVTVQGTRVNVRSGPGIDYPVIQILEKNDTALAIGFNSEQTWVQIEIPDGTDGWISADLVDIADPDEIDTITDISPAPIATSASPVATSSSTTSALSPTVAPKPTSPPSAPCVVTAWVNDETPAQRQHVYVYGTLLCGEQLITDASMHVVWHYKSTSETCDGVTDAAGTAACERSIGGASKGYYVRLDLAITHDGQTYYATTGFTPR